MEPPAPPFVPPVPSAPVPDMNDKSLPATPTPEEFPLRTISVDPVEASAPCRVLADGLNASFDVMSAAWLPLDDDPTKSGKKSAFVEVAVVPMLVALVAVPLVLFDSVPPLAVNAEMICPPAAEDVLIVVAPCVPVTSPTSEPLKLTAVVALATVPVTFAPVRLVRFAPEIAGKLLMTVAPCVPVTLPTSEPLTLTAVVAFATVPVTFAPVRLVKFAPEIAGRLLMTVAP